MFRACIVCLIACSLLPADVLAGGRRPWVDPSPEVTTPWPDEVQRRPRYSLLELPPATPAPQTVDENSALCKRLLRLVEGEGGS